MPQIHYEICGKEKQMKKVILHIGHGKTGTSFIQSCLALNRDRLDKYGIHYPFSNSFPDAQQGMISSGNAKLLIDDNFKFSSNQITLISGESLFHTLLLDENFSNYVQNKSDQITVILYTRDVLEMLTSAWGQLVKRSGETRSIDEFYSEQEDSHHSKVLQWLNLSHQKGFDLIIRNYSIHKKNIFNDFLSVLCVKRLSINIHVK